MTRCFAGLLLLILFAAASYAPAAQADELRPGYLEFTQTSESDWTVTWKAPMKGGLTPQTQPILPEGCQAKGKPRGSSYSGIVTRSFAVTCAGNVAGKTIGLSDMDSAQTDILLRVAPLDRPVQAMRITAAQPTVTIAEKPGTGQVAWTYFVTGIQHIIFGFDHLLFVVALVLLLTGGWTVVKAITAFTIAHSITLVGTTLGFMGLPQRPVEAVIALSILFLAVEIIKRDPQNPEQALRLSQRMPWLIAFLFGLLHGFGFAGALKEIGLPEDDIPTALLAFNLGVEAGQLAIVALCMGILWALRRFTEQLMRPAIVAATYAIGITSSYWLFDRLL